MSSGLADSARWIESDSGQRSVVFARVVDSMACASIWKSLNGHDVRYLQDLVRARRNITNSADGLRELL